MMCLARSEIVASCPGWGGIAAGSASAAMLVAGRPVAAVSFANRDGTATSTSWPAFRSAQSVGSIGYRCSSLGQLVARTFILFLPRHRSHLVERPDIKARDSPCCFATALVVTRAG